MRKNRRTAILISSCGVAFIVFIWALGKSGFRVNTTNSLPVGIYRVIPFLHHESFAVFCLPESIGRLSMERGYRPRGTCPDGGAPFLKRVVAVTGDRVFLSGSGIAVNGELLPKTAPRVQDRSGRPLQPWAFGNYIVSPDELWVASTYNQYSYDSRYFGPIRSASVLYSLKSVLTVSAPE